MLQLLILTFTFIISASAWSQLSFGPKGIKTSLMGNNGVALTANSSAGALNPATIVNLKDSRFSASSSVAQFSRVSISNESQIMDRSQAPEFNLTSGFIASSFLYNDWNFSFYAIEDVNIHFTKYLEFSSSPGGPVVGSSQIEAEIVTNRIGLVAGKDFGSWKWAAGPVILLGNKKNSSMTKTESGADTTAAFSSVQGQSTILTARGGWLYDQPSYSVGFYVEPGGFLVSQNQSKYAIDISTSGIVSDSSNIAPSNEVTSPHWAVGFQWKNVYRGSLYLDYSFWSETEYVDESEPNVAEQKKATQRAQRIGLGYMQSDNKDSAYGFGFQYTQLKDLDVQRDYDLVYLNVGRQQKVNFLNTFVNIFHSIYKEKNASNSIITTVGLSIGTEYGY